jgi:hypothetical protein
MNRRLTIIKDARRQLGIAFRRLQFFKFPFAVVAVVVVLTGQTS